MSNATALIRISEKTKKLIEEKGTFHDTYDTILQRVLTEKKSRSHSFRGHRDQAESSKTPVRGFTLD